MITDAATHLAAENPIRPRGVHETGSRNSVPTKRKACVLSGEAACRLYRSHGKQGAPQQTAPSRQYLLQSRNFLKVTFDFPP
jgi:hypothetical protein